ncbi:hypothetical protein CISG_07842 [Coccidioides immitis RMSCC 3703]|uniref:Protein SIP5 n=1 Tax=Coccidioides immitis RMSCC 3703 TaxID=454286 RepID=A0A0J8R3V7_COCIT|nr:hypothetical protein CISG_07842 [Coccidioides immitis RMSCC 3703]
MWRRVNKPQLRSSYPLPCESGLPVHDACHKLKVIHLPNTLWTLISALSSHHCHTNSSTVLLCLHRHNLHAKSSLIWPFCFLTNVEYVQGLRSSSGLPSPLSFLAPGLLEFLITAHIQYGETQRRRRARSSQEHSRSGIREADQPLPRQHTIITGPQMIKRPDPHPPEHHDPNNSETTHPDEPEGQLVSEPAACPFCVQPEFGVMYTPPPFRRGLAYAASPGVHALANSSAASSASSLVSGGANPGTRRRAVSISADSPSVITTDRVRPDWATKLAAARAQAARRSAAATALHTAAYMMNNPGGPGEPRRRGMLRRTAGQDSPGGRTAPSHVNAMAYLAERRVVTDRDNASPVDSTTNLAPPRASSRRSRIDELEEMMMMEAIRLSLAAEEERRKKEEKETRKEAKRREKEAKKAEKSAKKAGLDSQNPSNLTSSTSSANSAVQTAGGANSELDMSANKGKGVDRSEPRPGVSTEAGSSTEPPKITIKDLKGEQFSSMLEGSSKNMHLRHVSSASSSNSSLVESAFGESIGSGTPHNGSSSSLAAIHGFRSLAAMIDDTPSGDSGESMNRPGSTNEQVQGAPAVKEPSENSAPNEPDQVTLLSSSPSLEQKDTLGKEVHMSSAEVLPQSSLGTAS